MTHPVRQGPGSSVERARLLVQEAVASLFRCPPERREAATHEALSTLSPHLEAALEELETIGRLRDLTDVELARQRAFMMLVGVAGEDDHRLLGHRLLL
jgi:hypothetical protein